MECVQIITDARQYVVSYSKCFLVKPSSKDENITGVDLRGHDVSGSLYQDA